MHNDQFPSVFFFGIFIWTHIDLHEMADILQTRFEYVFFLSEQIFNLTLISVK